MTDLLPILLGNDPDRVRRELTDPDQLCDNGRRPLSVAAAVGDIALIDLLLGLGVPIDGQDGNTLGYTALGTAVREGRSAAAAHLLRCGADPNAGDSIGGTPLHHAAVAGEADLADLLLRHGARVDTADGAGVTPLIRVATQADAARTTVLDPTDGSFKPAPHPLHDAHLATAAVLLAAGAQPDHLDDSGYTALHHAAANGAVSMVETLLAGGASVRMANPKGYAPLHAACDGGHAGVARALLRAGADPGAADGYGFAPLHGAAQNGSAETVQVLLAAGAQRTPRTRDGYDRVTAGMTPADVAAAYGHDELAILLAPGA